jgi:hypothetical protein
MVNAARQAGNLQIEEGKEVPPEVAEKAGEHMLEVMWSLSVLEIEATLRSACHKALADRSVNKESRKRRAEGLIIMGDIFLQHAGSIKDGLVDVGERMGLKGGPGAAQPLPDGEEGSPEGTTNAL